MHELILREILERTERTETRVRSIQFRTIRMERNIMTLKDDVSDLKASVAALITAFQTAQTDVQAKIDAAVAADEAGTDVDIKQLQTDITAALAPVAPAVAAAKAASA